MLAHYTEFRHGSNMWPWRNFTPEEMACRCGCGEVFYDPLFMDDLQALRYDAGKPLHLNSCHRCELHNAAVGGAALSAHLENAADIDLFGHDRKALAKAASKIGFIGRGYYVNFLHLDKGGFFNRARFWFSGEQARELWA